MYITALFLNPLFLNFNNTLMKNYLTLIFALLLSGIEAQTIFEFTKYDEKSQPAIETEMYKYHIEPDMEQMNAALKDIMQFEIKLHYIYKFIRKFPNACSQEMFREFISKWESDLKMEEIPPYLDSEEGQYKFMCLDFNGDKQVDVILMPEYFFGPSFGLVCYAKVDGKFIRVFDKAGYIVKFEKRAKKIVFQFEITTIEDAETNILETLVYDLKTKMFSHNSKLYFATDTRLPQKTQNIGKFKLSANAIVRADTVINNEIFPEDWFNEYGRGSKKLRGNVVADYPAGAEGCILAKEKDFVFVAFMPEAKFLDCSLKHGMDSEDFENYKPNPKPFICGWISKKDLKKLKTNK
jgi:hypothetical protein